MGKRAWLIGRMDLVSYAIVLLDGVVCINVLGDMGWWMVNGLGLIGIWYWGLSMRYDWWNGLCAGVNGDGAALIGIGWLVGLLIN